MNENVTVFALDDNEEILELYRNILAKQNNPRLDFFDNLEKKDTSSVCDLHTFSDSEVYLDTIIDYYENGNRVPLSIIDMRMPNIHGLDVAKEVRKLDSEMSIVVVTGYSDYSIKDLLSQLQNRVYYLSKPFKEEELYAVVHSNLMEWNEKNEARLIEKELAIDSIEDGLWSWNIITNDVYFSPRWKEMLGYEDHELESKFESWFFRIHTDDTEGLMQAVQAHLNKETEFFVNEHRLRTRDGSYKHILARGKALFNDNGEAYKMTGFHTDISQRKLLEKELQILSESLFQELSEGISEKAKLSMTNVELEKQLEKEIQIRREKEEMLLQQTRQAAMGEMISMIAHQWRQPLTIIGLTADNMSLDLDLGSLDDATLSKGLSGIADQVKYLSQTIDDFRQFFTPNKEKESVLLQECLENACRIIDSSLKVKNIQLIKIYEDISPIDLYKNEIMQVFLNIIKNAEDAFCDEITSPSITLQTKEYDSYVEVRIADNAGGIDPDILKKIFEPYFTTKGKKHGTGLGLYMSKTIIQEHSSGSIEVANINGGAVFIMKFPK